ncbi:hypothetical protein GTU79_08805 [Sodalis ligni]|uniref:hypothetical protein n=1 Tax=Sodalis ligni TaxID=2697027 RepID=UPI0019400C5C|nr:hypothetical protein [Sodalis ligni]QWA12773.1 hypothetical protein GTU79_08805 [Sodalis ligni]
MLKAGVLYDAMGKIASLAAAAQFLTDSREEQEIQIELIGLIEDIALKAKERAKESSHE